MNIRARGTAVFCIKYSKSDGIADTVRQGLILRIKINSKRKIKYSALCSALLSRKLHFKIYKIYIYSIIF